MLDYLEEFYYGAYSPVDQCRLEDDPKFDALYEELKERLGQEDRALLEKLLYVGRGRTNRALKECYFEGFRMGAGLMLQLFP